MTHCIPVATPYVKPVRVAPGVSVHGIPGAEDNDSHAEAKGLSSADATLYRRAAARINYIALDRPDLSFASRAAWSHMSCPKEGNDPLI